MNFEDEPYVRVFTRDTANWIRMKWEGRALLPGVMRKLDRNGMIDLEADGEEGVAVLAELVRLPLEVVAVGLEDLLARSTLAARGTTIIMPNFQRAQEFAKSDADRAREYRQRRRDTKMKETDSSDRFRTSKASRLEDADRTPTVTNVTTKRDGASVTKRRDDRDADPPRHASRQNVTVKNVTKRRDGRDEKRSNQLHDKSSRSRADNPTSSRKRVTARDGVTLPSFLPPSLPPISTILPDDDHHVVVNHQGVPVSSVGPSKSLTPEEQETLELADKIARGKIVLATAKPARHHHQDENIFMKTLNDLKKKNGVSG